MRREGRGQALRSHIPHQPNSSLNPALRKYRASISKTDAVDAETLARLGALVQPASWTPPPPEVRTLQARLARQHAVAEDRRRERNRLEKAQATTTPARVLTSLNESLIPILHRFYVGARL